MSVVMVFHRDTPFLRPAIASVLEQTFRDLELVLVDNGTGLAAAALGRPGLDPRITWVRMARDNGIGIANNAGVQAAAGEFIALHDSDDLSHPGRIERQVTALRAGPAVDFVSALADRIDAEGRKLPGRVFTLTEAAEFHRYSQYGAPLINPLSMARRDVFVTTLFRPQFRYAGDLDFMSRLAERWRLAAIPEVLMQYRWHPAQTTQKQAADIEQSRGVINLLTARRRAGRPENPESVPWMNAAMSPAEHCRRIATQCLQEGFPVSAAYLARRSFAVERTTGAGRRAVRIAAGAWRQARGGERTVVARMFLAGPVKALRVHPDQSAAG